MVREYWLNGIRKSILMLLERLKGSGFELPSQVRKFSRTRQIFNTHWVKIPNSRKFIVRVSGWNVVAAYFGIRLKNTPTFESEKFLNGPYNRYMIKQIKRLKGLKGDPVKFFRIVRFLIAKSRAFKVSALCKMEPRWYKEMPLWLVYRTLKDVDKCFQKDRMKFS